MLAIKLYLGYTSQWAKSPKNSLKEEYIFVNSALKIQCHHVVKNTLLQTAFSAILPTGVIQK